MPVPPNVTGISPRTGPPGTKLTIRGENFGADEKSLKSMALLFL